VIDEHFDQGLQSHGKVMEILGISDLHSMPVKVVEWRKLFCSWKSHGMSNFFQNCGGETDG